MIQLGTIVNGVVVLDTPAKLPEGSRVRVELDDEAAVWEQLAGMSPERETYEEHLEKLRQSIAEGKAGVTQSASEALAEISAELGLDEPELR